MYIDLINDYLCENIYKVGRNKVSWIIDRSGGSFLSDLSI
jgi:hypothetical protein